MNKIRIYVGHKLTKANPAFLERMQAIIRHAEQNLSDTCEFMKFLGTKDGTSWDVFDKDIEQNVKNCDLFICIVDEESTGLGMEIGAAFWKSGKPMLLVRTMHTHVSRLPLGSVQHYPQQILDRSMTDVAVIDSSDFVSFIQEAITIYRLGTDEAFRYPSLDVLAKAAGLEIGVPIPRGWKS